MSNSLFLALMIAVVAGVVFYKSTEQQEVKAPIIKKIKRNNRPGPVVVNPPKAQTETSVTASVPAQPAQASTPSPAPSMPEPVSKPAAVVAPTAQSEPMKPIPMETITAPTATYFEVKSNLPPEEKFQDINKLVQFYRSKLDEMYKDKQLFYTEGDKVETLLSDTASYILNPENYTKESDPKHINDIKEFIENVYKLRDQGNQNAQQNKK